MSHDIDLTALANRSILIIDDNHALHRDYYAVLCPDQNEEEEAKLDELENFLLGNANPAAKPRPVRNFSLQSAYQGEEAFNIVKKHRGKGIRYPLAFVDMRMPPGWDGLETIERIRELDDEIYFVVVSAYSDYADDEIAERLGPEVSFAIICKPFDPAEIYRMSYRIVREWNRRHAAGETQS